MADNTTMKISQLVTDFADQNAIDMEHLSRQTMGDDQLAAEILSMFSQQCENCLESLVESAGGEQISQIAHQMKGCARSVGAFAIGDAAGDLEENPANHEYLNMLKKLCASIPKQPII